MNTVITLLGICIIFVFNKELNTKILHGQMDSQIDEILINLKLLYLWLSLYQTKKENRALMFYVWYNWHFFFKIDTPIYLFALL